MSHQIQQRTVNAAKKMNQMPSIAQRLITLSGTVLFLGTFTVWQPLVDAAPKPSKVKAPPLKTQPAKEQSAKEQPPKTPAPEVLLTLLKQMDDAASRKDFDAAMKFYSPNFTHQDGLNYKTWGEALKIFWKDTPTVRYQTQIDSWQVKGTDQYILETTTKIEGTQKAAERDMQMTSTVRSRIAITGQTIASQEILSEQTRLTAGTKPPIVQFNLPEQVNVGQSFSFDAIVKDPLGNNLLLGSAVEEPITPERYAQRKEVVLEPLSSGGLFKVGQAPGQPARQWISAVLVQENGMTIVSQRLNVVKPNSSAGSKNR